MSPLPLGAPFFALWSTQQGATGLGTSGPWAAAQRASGLRLRDPGLRGRRHLGGRTSQPPRPTRRRPRLFTSLAPRRAAAVASTATATTAVNPYAPPATNSRTCAGAACRRRCLRSDQCFKKWIWGLKGGATACRNRHGFGAVMSRVTEMNDFGKVLNLQTQTTRRER